MQVHKRVLHIKDNYLNDSQYQDYYWQPHVVENHNHQNLKQDYQQPESQSSIVPSEDFWRIQRRNPLLFIQGDKVVQSSQLSD